MSVGVDLIQERGGHTVATAVTTVAATVTITTVTTTTATVSATALVATTAASALRSLVYANGTAVESAEFSTSCPMQEVEGRSECACCVLRTMKYPSMVFLVTHSISFMALIAASASSSFEKRTKPKPRLRPVSRSLTTT